MASPAPGTSPSRARPTRTTRSTSTRTAWRSGPRPPTATARGPTTTGRCRWPTATTSCNYVFTFAASDAARNVSSDPATRNVTIDTTAYVPVFAGVVKSVDGSGTPILVISGTAQAGAQVNVMAGGSSIGTANVDGHGNWQFSYRYNTSATTWYYSVNFLNLPQFQDLWYRSQRRMLVIATLKSQGNPGKQGFPERQASLHAECPEKPNGVVLEAIRE